jgi:hypothetical protein
MRRVPMDLRLAYVPSDEDSHTSYAFILRHLPGTHFSGAMRALYWANGHDGFRHRVFGRGFRRFQPGSGKLAATRVTFCYVYMR